MILLFFGAAAVMIIAGVAVPPLIDRWLPKQPTVSTAATIVEIKGARMHRSGSLAAYVTITFRSSKGLIGRTQLDLDEVNCRVGDVVKARQEGADLFLDGGACSNLRTAPRRS